MILTLQKKIPSRLSRIMLVGLMSSLLGAVAAQAEQTNATVMKPVVVTGSLIPTAETVGAAPVNTVTAVDIQRAGQQDILSTLTRLDPSFSGSFNLGQVANNFTVYTTPIESAGEANVAIRNLPSLVLLDGRRLGNSALSAGQAVDLNTIPLSIVDRVEVLKDGASALYGSDAIGGVVNVITKRNWNGTEIGGRIGFPTRKDSNDILERRASIITGASGDNYSLFAGAQYYYMDPLLAKDRHTASASITDLLKAKDDRGNVGIAPPSYFSPSFPGRVQDGKYTNSMGDVIPATSFVLAGSPFAQGASNSLYHAIPGLNTPPIVSGGPFSGRSAVDQYNEAAFNQLGYRPYVPLSITPLGMEVNNALIAAGQEGLIGLYPTLNTTLFGVHSIQTQDRRNFFANFERDLFEKNLQVFGSFLFANNHSEGQLAPSPVPSLGGSAIAVPGTNPFNPFGVDLGLNGAGTPRVRYRFVETANRVFDAQSDVYHFIGGLKGEIGPKYDWELAYDYNRSEQTDFTRNAINGEQLNRALAGTATDPSGNPLPSFNIFSLPGFNTTNAPDTVNSLKTTLFQSGVSELWSVDGHVHGAPFDLPAGPFDIVIGGTYVYESLSFSVDGLTQLGLVPGLNAAFPFGGGTRDRYAGFAEARIPVFSESKNIPGFYSFEITAAGRYEKISPGGDSAVPKVGVRWQPIDKQLTVRGGYTEGFIAPSIFSLFGPDTISDPVIALAGGGGQVQTQTRSNPDLPPSESQQWGVGFVYSPKQVPGLTVSADYYNIRQNNVIIADHVTAAKSLNQFGSDSPFAPGFTFADGTPLATPAPNQVTVDNWGNLLITNQASAAIRTDGLDLTANYEIPTETAGKFTLMANANLTLNFEVQSDPSQPYRHYEGLWTANFGTAQGLIPDYRLNFGLSWDFHDFTYTVLAHYIPPVTDPGTLHPQVAAPGAANIYTVNGKAWYVPDYYTIDMQLAYNFGPKWGRFLRGTRLAVGVNNVLDEDPPLIASAFEDNTDKSTYDILGRFVYFEISKKF